MAKIIEFPLQPQNVCVMRLNSQPARVLEFRPARPSVPAWFFGLMNG